MTKCPINGWTDRECHHLEGTAVCEMSKLSTPLGSAKCYWHEPAPTIPLKAKFDAFVDRWKNHPQGWQEWLEEENMRVYIRFRSYWISGHALQPCIVIANIAVPESKQKDGRFTRFLGHVEKKAAHLKRTVVIENVLNPCLHEFLDHRGYMIQEGGTDGSPPTYYR